MRLSIELTDKQHKAIKSFAALRGVSIKDFVIGKIFSDETSKFNEETQKVFMDTDNNRGLHKYDNIDDFISDMEKL